MKIDCTITKNYLKETQRMCDYYGDCLEGCPAANVCKKMVWGDDSLETIVQLWSDSHPQKTYLEDFKEKYPNAPLVEDGTPTTCPKKIGFKNIYTCNELNRCVECWNQLI